MSDEYSELKHWEDFRIEMQTHESRLGKLAKSFLALGAYGDAANCAIKAEGIKYVIARMPKFDHGDKL